MKLRKRYTSIFPYANNNASSFVITWMICSPVEVVTTNTLFTLQLESVNKTTRSPLGHNINPGNKGYKSEVKVKRIIGPKIYFFPNLEL